MFSPDAAQLPDAGLRRPPQGWSIHIGLNAVDPASYNGWHGRTPNAESDAKAMHALAVAAGFHRTTFLTGAMASRADVHAALLDAAAFLQAGDLFLLTFAGHGARTCEKDGPRGKDEADGFDESWCLWDGFLLDDEVHVMMSRFAAGVRVLVVADSCFSGTMTRFIGNQPPVREIPPGLAQAAYEVKRELYQQLRAEVRAGPPPEVAASVLLLAACAEDRWAFESEGQGLFTRNLVQVWDGGAFRGTYEELVAGIRAGTGKQKPQLYRTGRADPAFEAENPFTIARE